MAENTMFLVHRPTGYAVLLARRDMRGWGAVGRYDLHDALNALFLKTEWHSTDDFFLAMRDATGCPGAIDKTQFAEDEDEDNVFRVKVDESVPIGVNRDLDY